MKNILFRADSSQTIGTGHIMRDLVLSGQYPKESIIFATQNLEGNINHKIIESGYKLETLNSNSIEEVLELIKKYQIDMLVIDHYGIGENYEKQLKIQNPTLKIMVLDDTYQKHYCDILLNHNIYAKEKRYKNLVPDFCTLRCGSRYTLIRDEFLKLKIKKRVFKTKKKLTIFVAMGGTDYSDINIQILKVIKKFKKFKVNLVTTTANRNLAKLQKYILKNRDITLFVNSNQIAKIMQKSDFAIVTPSVIINEVYFIKLPFIAIQVANNQCEMFDYLKKRNYFILKQFSSNKLRVNIEKLLKT